MTKLAVVTGASSGIGAATARRLATEGYRVIVAARRIERLVDLADAIGGTAIECDVTSADAVAALAAAVGPRLDLLVNNAGGALGAEPVAEADFDKWTAMFASNVVGSGRVTKALLPALREAEGTIVFITSTAADAAYEGGSGYNAAKAGERMIVDALRLEIVDQPIRVCDIAPGMVRTDEFALTRFGGDASKAASVYQGVAEPLVAEDIADIIAFVATRPPHVNLDRITVRPRAQASNFKVHRTN
ncbi:MAG: SDR family NAD(P)-dependent oxidoreductase [Propionibacteriaceae bacterium]